MPRKLNDFVNNDDIYGKLAAHDRDENSPIRCLEEMINEAESLRKCIN